MDETIVAAAIRAGRATVYDVVRPGRHHDVIAKMSLHGWRPPDMHDQGFLTSANRFVDRREAYRIAEAAGQIKSHSGPEGVLFSEDMW